MQVLKKNFRYITIVKVVCYLLSLVLGVYAATETWSKSSYNNSSDQFIYLTLFLIVAFPVFGLIAYFMLSKTNPEKAKAYRTASIIELSLIFILLFLIGNIGR